MAGFNVNTFRSSLQFDGARASMFEVYITLPPVLGLTPLSSDIRFKVRATSLPGDSINSISVPYFGREIKVAGTRNFPDWSFQVINDENFEIRNNLELWMSQINSHVGNIRSGDAPNSISYTTDGFVYQYNKEGKIIKTYNIVGAFPVDVSPIDLDWASGDQIEEFSVTFAYQYWTSVVPTPVTDLV